MKIFVIGSCRNLEEFEQERFKAASESLGVALGKTDHTLIICSAREITADPHLVRGLNSVVGQHKVTVYRPDRETLSQDPLDPIDAYADDDEYPNVRFNRYERIGGWRVVHLRALRECDMVIAIAGDTRGTGTAIYSAEVLEKPVILIPSLGGAAANTAWKDFRRYYLEDETLELQRPGSDLPWAEQILATALAIAKWNPFATFHRGEIIAKAGVGLVLFLLWAYLFTGFAYQLPAEVAIILMLILSSLFGTFMRSTLRTLGVVRGGWPTNVFAEALIGLGLAFAILVVTEATSFFLSAQAVEANGLGDVQRLGIGLSATALLTSLFIEDAWRRISTAGARF